MLMTLGSHRLPGHQGLHKKRVVSSQTPSSRRPALRRSRHRAQQSGHPTVWVLPLLKRRRHVLHHSWISTRSLLLHLLQKLLLLRLHQVSCRATSTTTLPRRQARVPLHTTAGLTLHGAHSSVR